VCAHICIMLSDGACCIAVPCRALGNHTMTNTWSTRGWLLAAEVPLCILLHKTLYDTCPVLRCVV